MSSLLNSADSIYANAVDVIPREEFEKWWEEIGAREVVISWHNKNSWRGFGRTRNGLKPAGDDSGI